MHQCTNAHVTCVVKVVGDVGEMPVGVHMMCAWRPGVLASLSSKAGSTCVCWEGGAERGWGEEWYV